MKKIKKHSEAFLEEALKARSAKGNLRQLSSDFPAVDFTSNDYLGFARSPKSFNEVESVNPYEFESVKGSGGSRLLSGNTPFSEALETQIASFHKAEAGLLYGSGYLANSGLISCLAKRGDVVLFDALVHASIRDGIQLSHARNWSFRHNDLSHLKVLLEKSKKEISEGKNIYILTESVFSMDGDLAPLQALVDLAEKFNALLIVDEAHAVGIYGESGSGLVCELGLENAVFARVVTFGKALGCHGAIVLGSSVLRQYLINFSRTFIYTTALPESSLKTIEFNYFQLKNSIDKILKTISLSELFNVLIQDTGFQLVSAEISPIKALLAPGNEAVKQLAIHLQKAGFDIRPIMSPTVPFGQERVRIVLHAFNTEDEVRNLVQTLKSYRS